MNKGQWFSSPKKIFAFIVNLIILGIACTIVCSDRPFLFKQTSRDILTLPVWTGSLRLGQVDSRKLFQGQLDLRQQRYLDLS